MTQHLGFPLNGLQSKHRETETYGDVRWNIVLLGKQRVCEGLCLTEENIFELEFLAARLVKGNCWAGNFFLKSMGQSVVYAFGSYTQNLLYIKKTVCRGSRRIYGFMALWFYGRCCVHKKCDKIVLFLGKATYWEWSTRCVKMVKLMAANNAEDVKKNVKLVK